MTQRRLRENIDVDDLMPPGNVSIVARVKEIIDGDDTTALTRFIAADSHDDILQHWTRSNSSNDVSTATGILKLLSTILQKLDLDESLAKEGSAFVRRILSEHSKSLIRNINSCRALYVNPTLKLLITMCQYDYGSLANEVYSALDMQSFKALWNSLVKGPAKKVNPEKVVLGKRKREEVEAGGPARGMCLGLLFTLLKNAQSSIRVELLTHQDIGRDLFRYILFDRDEDVIRTIKSLSHVLEDRDVARTAKVKFFNDKALSYLGALYTKGNDEVDVRTQIHALMLAATTIPDSGVCFVSRGLLAPPTRNKLYNPVLANFVVSLKPLNDDLQMDLLVGICKAAPELIADYLSRSQLDLTPKLDSNWIKSMTIIDRLVSIPFPEENRNMDVPVDLIMQNSLPSIFSKVLLKGLQHESDLVKLMTAKTFLSCLTKMSTIKNHFGEEINETCIERCQAQSPDIHLLLPLTQLPVSSEEMALLREALIGILRRYTELFEDLPAFDFVTLFSLVMSGTESTESERSNVLKMVTLIPSVLWLTRKKGSDTIFTTIMRYILADDKERDNRFAVGSQVLMQLTTEETFMFSKGPIAKAACMIQAIQASEVIIPFIEESMIRFQAAPYKFFDQMMEVKDSLKGDEVINSPILMAFRQQLKFLSPAERVEVHAWLVRLVSKMSAIGEDEEYCKFIVDGELLPGNIRKEANLENAVQLVVRISRTGKIRAGDATLLMEIYDDLVEKDVLKIFIIEQWTDAEIWRQASVIMPVLEKAFDVADVDKEGLCDLFRQCYLQLPSDTPINHFIPDSIITGWLTAKTGDLPRLSRCAIETIPDEVVQRMLAVDAVREVLCSLADLIRRGVYDASELALKDDFISRASKHHLEYAKFLVALLSRAHLPEMDELALDFCRQSDLSMSAPVFDTLVKSEYPEIKETAIRLLEKHSGTLLSDGADASCRALLAQYEESFAAEVLASLLAKSVTLLPSELSLFCHCIGHKQLAEANRPAITSRNKDIANLLIRRFAEDRIEESKALSDDVLDFVTILTVNLGHFTTDCTPSFLDPMVSAAIENQSQHAVVLAFLRAMVEHSTTPAFNYTRIVQDVINKGVLAGANSSSGASLILQILKREPSAADVGLMDGVLMQYSGTCSEADQVLFQILQITEATTGVSIGSRFKNFRFAQTLTEMTEMSSSSIDAVICSEIAIRSVHHSDPTGSVRSDFYDNKYLLPLIAAYIFADPSIDVIRQLIEHHALGSLFVALSNDSPEIRESAAKGIGRFHAIISENHLRDLQQVYNLLTVFRSSVTITALRLEALPLVHTTFLALSIPVLLNPSHYLYKKLNMHYLTQPQLSFHDAPLFMSLWTGEENYSHQVLFLLKVLHAGIPVFEGTHHLSIYRRRHVLELMMSLFSAATTSHQMKVVIAKTLLRLCKSGYRGHQMAKRAGLGVWCALVQSHYDILSPKQKAEALEWKIMIDEMAY